MNEGEVIVGDPTN